MYRNIVANTSKLLIAFTLIFGTFNMKLNAEEIVEAINVVYNTSYNDDYSEAEIVIENLTKESYTIQTITNSQGEEVVEGEAFHINENGEYVFDIQYVNNQEQDTTQTISKTVTIDEIATPTTEAPSSEVSINPTVVIADGGVTLEVPTYDGQFWNNGEVKRVEVTANFGDRTSENKKLDITIAEGMRIESVMVNDKVDKTGVNQNILINYGSTDPLAVAIKKITVPKPQQTSGTTFGTLSYEFEPGTESATISFTVSVDRAKYYGPHTIPNAIQASASKGGTSLGQTKIDVIAKGTPIGGISHDPLSRAGEPFVLSSTADVTGTAKGNSIVHVGLYENGGNNPVNTLFAKKVVITAYYPVGTELVRNTNGGLRLISNDPSIGQAVYERTGILDNSVLGYELEYKTPIGLPAGEYSNYAKDKIEYTWYNGATTTTSAPIGYKVTVQDTYPNKAYIVIGLDEGVQTDIPELVVYEGAAGFKNLQPGEITNQTYEVEIEENFKTLGIYFPFYSALATNEVTSMYYKTNLNSQWTAYTGTYSKPTNTIAYVSKDKIGLASNEYITAFKANIGTLPKKYESSGFSSEGIRTGLIGTLDQGSGVAHITYKMYDETNLANSYIEGLQTITEADPNNKRITGNNSAEFMDTSNKPLSGINGGEAYRVKAKLQLSEYFQAFQPTQAVRDPEIYLRQPKDHFIDLNSIKVVDNKGQVVNYTYTSHVNSLGETLYVLKTSNAIIGSYFGANLEIKDLTITYDVNTGVKAAGAYNTNMLISWGIPNAKVEANWLNIILPDTYDFNGNGNVTESMLTVSSKKSLLISENKNVLVETFLSLENEDPKGPYIESNPSTVALFTPGTKADYTIKITNNGDYPADSIISYVPIPKGQLDLGTPFQNGPSNWDMSLTKAIELDPSLVGLYSIEYATIAQKDNYTNDEFYSTTLPVLIDDIIVVRIKSLQPLPAKTTAEFKIPLRVNETFASATAGNKIGTRNVFYPNNAVVSPSYTGDVAGTKAGAELVIAEIGGTVFNDVNADGLYRVADGDTPISGHVVELYKFDELTSLYFPVLDNNAIPITTTTNAQGVYQFDYTDNVGYGIYAVKFVEKTGGFYEYTIHNSSDKTINSDAIITNDTPTLGDRYKGWVIGIEAIKPDAKTIGAGFISYNPPVDLKVEIDAPTTSVKVGETIDLATNIEPTFWENIKNPATPYTWNIVGDATEQAKANLVNHNDGTVTIKPNFLSSGTTTMYVTATIMDAYGNQATSLRVPIIIISNVVPTITGEPLVKYVGDTANVLEGIQAVDNTGAEIILVVAGGLQNTTITNVPPVTNTTYSTPGTYEVTYVIKDANRNAATFKRIIQVHGLPKIEANSQTYDLATGNILGLVENAATASYQMASTGVNQAPTTQNLAVSTTVVAGPSQDFSVAGLYTVEYTASTPELKTITKTVKVLVNASGVVTDPTNTLTINATGFTIANDQAASMDDASVISLANAIAVKKMTDGSGNISFEDITNYITVNETELQAIVSAPKAGGTYNLTFTIKDGSIKISKVVQVYVAIATDPLTVDLGLPREMKVGESLIITPTITPTFWDQIQASTNAYVWEFMDVESANHVTMVDANAEALVINATTKTTSNLVNIKLTITDREGRQAVSTMTVKVNTNVPPTINAHDQHVYVGDTKDIMLDVSATDDEGQLMTLDASNTEILEGALAGSDVYLTAGTYEVTYNVSDQYGNVGTKTVLILVDGLPEMEANGQIYELEEGNILDKVENAATATYLKASMTANQEATLETLAVQTTLISGPSTDFNVEGIYTVQYDVATPEGRTIQETVQILVNAGGSVTDPSKKVTLNATPFGITNDQAQSFNEPQAIELAQAIATRRVEDSLGNISFEDISNYISVNESQLEIINNATKSGGYFDLTYTIKDGAIRVNKTIKVYVAIAVEPLIVELVPQVEVKVGDTVLVEPTIEPAYWNEIKADTNAYQWEFVDANGLDYATIVDANAPILELTGVTKTTDLVAVRLTITDREGHTATTEMLVKVNTNVPPTITAFDQDVYVGDPKDLLQNVSAIDDDGQVIVLDSTNTKITETLLLDSLVYVEAGTYEVKYEVTDQYGNVGEKVVTIRVHGLPEILADAQTYTIGDTAIALNVKAAAKASWKQASSVVGAKAEDVEASDSLSYQVLSGPNGNLDFREIGVYQVQYSATNPDGKVTTKTVPVLIMPQDAILDPTGTIYLSANGFIIDNTRASTLTEALVKDVDHANVHAFEIVKDAQGNITGYNDITNTVIVDADQLKQINQTKTAGAIHTLNLKVSVKDASLSKDIKVVVTGTNTPEPKVTPDSNLLAISVSDFTISYENAKTITPQQAVQMANVKALLVNEVATTFALNSSNIVVSVNENDLKALQNASENGGSHQLVFTATYKDANNNETSISATSTVTVTPSTTLPKTGQSSQLMVGLFALAIGTVLLRKKENQ